MSKGRPGIARPNYSPSPSCSPPLGLVPALRPPCGAPCRLPALRPSPPRGDPRGLPLPSPRARSPPPPPSHTFPPLAITTLLRGPPFFPPLLRVSSHRVSRQHFFPPVEGTFPPTPFCLDCSRFLKSRP